MLDVRFCYIFRYKMMFYLFHLRWIPNHFNFLKYSTLMLFFSYILYYIPRETFLFWFHISFREFSDIFIPLELLERQGVLYELPEGAHLKNVSEHLFLDPCLFFFYSSFVTFGTITGLLPYPEFLLYSSAPFRRAVY